ncbi:hypothetical protein KQI63_03475 [bacterium]|nr:hypothetical protein [bacterium]
MGNVRPGDLDAHLDSLFTSGRFGRLEVEALRLLHSSRDVSHERQVAAHLYLGFSWVLTDRDEEANGAFLQALQLEPSLDLDEVYVPPRLYEAFQQARLEFLSNRDLFRSPIAGTPHLPHYKLGTGLNLVLPGAGFIASGRHLRGTIWTTAFLGCSGTFVYTLLERSDAHTDYLRQANPALIEDRYQEFNRLNKQAWFLGLGTALLYVGAQFDYQIADGTISAEPTLLESSLGSTPALSLTFRR